MVRVKVSAKRADVMDGVAYMRQLTREVCQAQLSLDAGYRHRRRWPLLGCEELAEECRRFGPVWKEGAAVPPASWPAIHFAPDVVSCGPQYYYQSNAGIGPGTVTDAQVADQLKSWFPLLPEIFEFAGDKLLVAGGAVVRALRSRTNRSSYFEGDLDLFLIGVPEAEARKFLEDLCTAVFVKDCTYSRNENCISISPKHDRYGYHRPYQLILRLYSSVDEVLGGFDLGCCAVGYSPNLGVVMTPLAAFSLATSTVLVDTSRRSTSYEARLLKYVRRGFRLVYPSLKYTDAGFKVSKLTFRPSSDKERQSNFPSSHRSTQYELPPEEKDEAKNDYGSDEHPSVFAYSNIIKAANAAAGETISSVTLVGSSLAELLDNPTVPGGVGLERLYHQRARNNFSCNHLPQLEMYKRWFGPDAREFIMAKFENNLEAMDDICARTVVRIQEVLRECARENARPLKFITIDPGRQTPLTGSFKPVWEPAAAYYPAELYRPTYVGLPSLELSWVLKAAFNEFGFPRDLQNHIVRDYIVPMYAHHVIDSFCSFVPPLEEKAEEAEPEDVQDEDED